MVTKMLIVKNMDDYILGKPLKEFAPLVGTYHLIENRQS